MEKILFISYLLIVSFCLIKIPFFKNSGIGKWTLACLLAMKVLAGIAYAAFYKLPKYYAGSDTWRFYRLSLIETKWLLKDPVAFLKDLFVYGYSSPGSVLSVGNSYWNDLKSNVIVKIMAVMNVFTNNSYYTNIILFNFLFLIGLVALFKVLNEVYPGKKKHLIAGLFLLPSTLFWCSGIHKDGLILSASGIVIYSFYKGLSQGFKGRQIASIMICFLLIFSLRNYVLFALIPALLAWGLSSRYKEKSLAIFSSIYLAGIVLFFTLPFIFPAINMPLYLSLKQKDFLTLQAGSAVSLPPLIPSVKGFISFFPYAFDMALFRPHISEIKNFSYIPATAEIILLFILIILTAFNFRKNKISSPFIYFLFFFSFSILLICGYTVPFSGAIVRYRSFVFPFLMTPLLCMIKINFNKKPTLSSFSN